MIDNKKEFNTYFRSPLLTIASSNDVEKWNYFFHFQDTKFVIPVCETVEENIRMEWIYEKNDFENDVQDILRTLASIYKFKFIKFVLESSNLKLSNTSFNSILYYII